MTLQEAMKRGGRFRREKCIEWFGPAENDWALCLTAESLLATDWEVEPKKITISLNDLWNAIRQVNSSKNITQVTIVPNLARDLARHLGFHKV